ncbi:type II toxin-antitoxin system ParD family antitoxin [Thermococcus sp.]|uniref:ribbon-helix-helix domain-containing protein n=1 Tax=Thermococcus sp. TaxID=35749 RepID=UPI0026309583|nr:type II toxin-antitoxin system ParD family antitoxin [Thermococcus sp.]
MAENVEYPVSVRLPGYVVRKIDELVKRREFRSRSDFIKFAVTLTLGQLMLEEAREMAKNTPPEAFERESEEAWEKLGAGDFEKDGSEVLKLIENIEKEYKRLMGAKE